MILMAAAVAAAAPDDVGRRVAGVYKHRFANGDVQGEKFTSEDILEIVPVRPQATYFRLHREFYNGHTCDISGIADQVGDMLVYTGPNDTSGATCRLTLAPSRGGIRIFEGSNGACRNQTCGARGGYGYADGDTSPAFAAAARRPIRYLPLILKSAEYKAALAEDATRGR